MWVDPLDGTKEYTQGYDVAHEVTVLIGIAWNGKPIAGIVNQPFFKSSPNGDSLGRLLWGIVGLGAFDLNRGRVERPIREPGAGKTIVTTRSHLTEIIRRDLTRIPNSKLMHCGGAGYKVQKTIMIF